MPMARTNDPPRLEVALRDEPDSLDLREKILEACSGDPKLHGCDVQVETILWFITNHPDNGNCRCPFTSINPEVAPDAYNTIKKACVDPPLQVPATLALASQQCSIPGPP